MHLYMLKDIINIKLILKSSFDLQQLSVRSDSKRIRLYTLYTTGFKMTGNILTIIVFVKDIYMNNNLFGM